MINRHTHIFGDGHAENSQQVVENWEDLKKREKGLKTHTQVLQDIPAVLPALVRSYKVQEKAAMVGFDWDNVEGALNKVYEELEELKRGMYRYRCRKNRRGDRGSVVCCG